MNQYALLLMAANTGQPTGGSSGSSRDSPGWQAERQGRTDRAAIAAAAQRLLEGGLVAFPTETVWGLGADAENPDAIAKIYRAKGRPADHPVIVHLAPGADLSYWAADIPEDAQRLIDAFWPGPLTLILPRAAHIPAAVSGGQNTVGLRCPAHPVAQALISTFAQLKPGGNGGVAAPSANRFGRISPTRASHVRAEFADSAEAIMVLDGELSAIGIESTIIDLSRYAEGVGPVLLRPGHITPAQIEAVLGRPVALPDQAAPRVSGSLKAHYAPRTPLKLMVTAELSAAVASEKAALAAANNTGRQRPPGVMALSARPLGWPAEWPWVHAPADADAYAAILYDTLRQLDGNGLAQIWLEQPPQTHAWQAVNDRLQRAAAAFA